MVIKTLLWETIDTLKTENIENAVFEANQIVRTVLKLSPIDMVLSYDKEVCDCDAETVREYAKKRCNREPLYYILGECEFMGLEFLVNKNVLLPRQDTEVLVEKVLENKNGMNVLDICTGSGCIALSLAHYNKKAYVLGLDISKDALKVANSNKEKLGLSQRVRFDIMDIMSKTPEGLYDVIVSNPPYIKKEVIKTLDPEVREYEPLIALDGGEDGLCFYRRIVEISPKLLRDGGMLYFEIGYDQAQEVKDIMDEYFEDITVVKDLSGQDRVCFGKKKAL